MKREERLKELIAVELLSEVLGLEIVEFSIIDNNIIAIERYDHIIFSLNIDTFCFKCKEWALKQNCELVTCVKIDRAICDIYSNTYNCKFTHYADTEQEAIIKATLWVMEQK